MIYSRYASIAISRCSASSSQADGKGYDFNVFASGASNASSAFYFDLDADRRRSEPKTQRKEIWVRALACALLCLC